MVDLRIQTTGQNLAQLQLEDVQNLAISVLVNLVKDNPNNSPPKGWSTIYTTPNYPGDTDSDLDVYDSEKMSDASFRIEHLINICGTVDSATLPTLLLPGSIEVNPVWEVDIDDPDDSYWDYTLILHKEVFPNYRKQIIITDKTPELTDVNKIFTIEVTVYWNVNSTEKSIKVTGEKSYAGSS